MASAEARDDATLPNSLVAHERQVRLRDVFRICELIVVIVDLRKRSH